jgi:hypothetical protein
MLAKFKEELKEELKSEMAHIKRIPITSPRTQRLIPLPPANPHSHE